MRGKKKSVSLRVQGVSLTVMLAGVFCVVFIFPFLCGVSLCGRFAIAQTVAPRDVISVVSDVRHDSVKFRNGDHLSGTVKSIDSVWSCSAMPLDFLWKILPSFLSRAHQMRP
jgi:hypothetical protein